MAILTFSKIRKSGFLAFPLLAVACGGSDFHRETFAYDGGSEQDSSRSADSATSDEDARSEQDAGTGDASHGHDDGAAGDGAAGDGATVDGGGTPGDAACDASHSWFRDEDGDGHGAGAAVPSCVATPPEGFAASDDDCNDESPLVNPSQTEFFEEAYEGSGGPSFDYDCSGDETPDPTNEFDEAPTCPPTLIGCGGTGYLPLDPPRAGNDLNPLCGSLELRSCVSAAFCFAEVSEATNAFRCR